MDWLVPTIPKFFIKKGPIEFLNLLWKSAKRLKKATLVIYPKSECIDIGPYGIDLWRYLKTELYNNWIKRTTAPPNYKDKYFCYASNSKYKP